MLHSNSTESDCSICGGWRSKFLLELVEVTRLSPHWPSSRRLSRSTPRRVFDRLSSFQAGTGSARNQSTQSHSTIYSNHLNMTYPTLHNPSTSSLLFNH
ncbi:hypothetical protein PGT21_026530 [Puccinia graminis f. sp. tritici]|uniref:Uncharacterized protein n=1 Tax=Puccinia graminis f. sp. tritici TaxID=56615 RepID=A0A5B0MYQ0_PUCGR|nr:hypothetical protein PGT21_026530 [Puccinia graminis f. sp. tritici]KAA1131125.1 hypothetical protein PGTUg99_012093 [Puccinia graminis f. sp. tritici]